MRDRLVRTLPHAKRVQKPLKWSWGSVISNACHASVAAVFDGMSDPSVRKYVSEGNGQQMHKVSQAAMHALAEPCVRYSFPR